MLAADLSIVTAELLKRVCDERWPESETLDFKQMVPGNDDKVRQDFVKDVCAFANSSGGDLVYGIVDYDGKANELAPLPLGSFEETSTRLTQILGALVEPPLVGGPCCLVHYAYCT